MLRKEQELAFSQQHVVLRLLFRTKIEFFTDESDQSSSCDSIEEKKNVTDISVQGNFSVIKSQRINNDDVSEQVPT